jgi:hypothetical protein
MREFALLATALIALGGFGPGFDSNERAFYDTRVLAIPTTRWDVYNAFRFGIWNPRRRRSGINPSQTWEPQGVGHESEKQKTPASPHCLAMLKY